MSSQRSVAAILAGISVAVLALTGCSLGGGAQGAASAPALPSTGWERTDRGEVADGGTLTLPMDAIPANWNLAALASPTSGDRTIADLSTASYVRITEDGAWEADKDFADSIEVKGDEAQVVEIKINKKAVWSDGTPMSADDFVATWTALNGSDHSYAANSTAVWEDVESVTEGDGPQDVLVTFAKRHADWPSILTRIWPKWLGSSPEAFNSLWAAGPCTEDGKRYVSGGPFVVTGVDRAGELVTFARNPEWWGAAPKLDTIVFKGVSLPARAQAFANGELDLIDLGAGGSVAGGSVPAAIETVQQRADAEIERSLSARSVSLVLNGTRGVFEDAHVREAFARALDREAIAKTGLGGGGAPDTVMGNLIFTPGQRGYEDDASAVAAHDVAAAKRLLDDAEWTGDGVREQDGARLSVRFVIPSDDAVAAAVAQQVLEQAGQAGFEVVIDTVPAGEFSTKHVNAQTRDFDVSIVGGQGSPFPIAGAAAAFAAADAPGNLSGVTAKSLEEDFARLAGELDPGAALDLAKQVDRQLVALAGVLPMASLPSVFAVRKGLVNYGPAQFETVDWTIVGWKK